MCPHGGCFRQRQSPEGRNQSPAPEESAGDGETPKETEDKSFQPRRPSQLQTHLVSDLHKHSSSSGPRGGAWLLSRSSSGAEYLLLPPPLTSPGSLVCPGASPSIQQVPADQEVEAELMGRQEPTCLFAGNYDPSVSEDP